MDMKDMKRKRKNIMAGTIFWKQLVFIVLKVTTVALYLLYLIYIIYLCIYV